MAEAKSTKLGPKSTQPSAQSRNYATRQEMIHAGWFARLLTISFVRVRNQSILRKLWRPRHGLLSILNICVKVKPFEHLAEADALRFVAAKTSIPVPTVYCDFTYKGNTYIVMRKVKGKMASHGWNCRSEPSKKHILDQLRQMMQELRSVEPPESLGVATVGGGPFYDSRLPSKNFWGPFTFIRDFHEALINGANVETNYDNPPAGLSELFDFNRQSFEKPVFTHGDLSSLNILVERDQVTGIIDWETAGWFPSYWEYTCARNVAVNAFTAEDIDKFLQPMPYELRMERIRRRYFDF